MSAPLKSPFCSVALSGLFCNSLIVKEGVAPLPMVFSSLWDFFQVGLFGSREAHFSLILGVWEFGSLDDTSHGSLITRYFSLVGVWEFFASKATKGRA